MKVKEQKSNTEHPPFCDYRQCQLLTNMEHDWAPVDNDSTAILELVIPNQALTMDLQFRSSDLDEATEESMTLRPSPQVTAMLLTKVRG